MKQTSNKKMKKELQEFFYSISPNKVRIDGKYMDYYVSYINTKLQFNIKDKSYQMYIFKDDFFNKDNLDKFIEIKKLQSELKINKEQTKKKVSKI